MGCVQNILNDELKAFLIWMGPLFCKMKCCQICFFKAEAENLVEVFDRNLGSDWTSITVNEKEIRIILKKFKINLALLAEKFLAVSSFWILYSLFYLVSLFDCTNLPFCHKIIWSRRIFKICNVGNLYLSPSPERKKMPQKGDNFFPQTLVFTTKIFFGGFGEKICPLFGVFFSVWGIKNKFSLQLLEYMQRSPKLPAKAPKYLKNNFLNSLLLIINCENWSQKLHVRWKISILKVLIGNFRHDKKKVIVRHKNKFDLWLCKYTFELRSEVEIFWHDPNPSYIYALFWGKCSKWSRPSWSHSTGTKRACI